MPSVGHEKRKQAWKRRYNLTEADYLRMLEEQEGKCKICKGPPDTKDGLLHVDHDHTTGAVRSLLCKACNTALGNIRDNPQTAAMLTEYLATYQPGPEVSPLPVTAVQRTDDSRDQQRGAAYLTDKQLRDARIPRPELLVAMEQAGLDKKQIAQELGLTLETTKKLLNEAQRGLALSFARDFLLRDVISIALAKVKMGVETDNKGEFSLELLTRLGTFPKEAAPAAPINKEGTFEEWRMSVIKRVSHFEPAEPPIEATVVNVESYPEGETGLHPVHTGTLTESGEDHG